MYIHITCCLRNLVGRLGEVINYAFSHSHSLSCFRYYYTLQECYLDELGKQTLRQTDTEIFIEPNFRSDLEACQKK